MTSVDVILPVLNERDAIGWVLSRMPTGFHPIVVDNGSDDGSAGVALHAGAQVVDAPVRGFGSACWAGLQAATAEIVCFMDCDGSLDPADLPRLVALLMTDHHDLVLGAREDVGGSWPVHARIANRYLAFVLRRRFGWDVRDLGPMRVVRRAALIELGMTDRRSGWPLEMALRAGRAGWRVAEQPVAYLPRTGKSKVTGTVFGTVQAIHDMRRQLTSLT